MANFKTQQVDIKSGTTVSKSVLPTTGHILPFAGPTNKIPSGWVLCDGTNGTPDLRGKFPGAKSNISVGGTESHSHTFSHSLSAFNAGNVVDSVTINSVSGGNNNAAHSHSGSANIYAIAWGDSGPANRATGTQANVIGRTHTHGGTISGGATFNSSNQSADHAHSVSSSAINANVSTSHSHSISSSPSATVFASTHTTPAAIYVNFIMKV